MKDFKKEDLERLIFVEKLSYVKIGKIYNVSDTTIKKQALKLGIKLPKRRKINPKETFHKNKKVYRCLNCGNIIEKVYSSKKNKYCSLKCQKEFLHKLKYQKIIDGDESIMRGNYSPKPFKDIIIKEQGGVCAICNLSQEWNGKKLVFILDHIDGNAANNKRDNLRCICPNCDSQLDTYKSKNKNGARSYYRYHRK